MTFIPFFDYQPVARFDIPPQPWTSIKIEESQLATGPWTLIDTIPIVDLDTDPANPKLRSFSTENATLEHGWYRVSVHDPAGGVSYFKPVENVPLPQMEYQPSIQDIANLLLTRTVDSRGVRLGTFNDNTTPSGIKVERYASKAANDLSLWIGRDIPDRLIPQAREVAALFGAMMVELNEFSDQVTSGRSPYAQLKELYDQRLPQLVAMVSEAESEDDTEDTTIDNMSPAYSFPVVNSGIVGAPQGKIGWGTRW